MDDPGCYLDVLFACFYQGPVTFIRGLKYLLCFLKPSLDQYGKQPLINKFMGG